MKQLIKILIICMVTIITTGCINYTELNELGIIESIGIDYQEGSYKIGINLIDARIENDESDEKRLYIEAEGTSIDEVFTNLYLKTNKKLDLAHIKVLVGTKEFFASDLTSPIHFFLTTKEVRPNFAVLYLKDATIKDVLELELENNSMYDLLLRNEQEYGITSLLTFEEFAKNMIEDSHDYVLPVIKIEKQTLELDSYTYSFQKEKEEFLTKNQAKLYNLLTNKTNHFTLNSPCQVERFTTMIMDNAYTTFSNDANQFKVSITGNLKIQNNPCHLDEKDLLNTYKKALSDEIDAFLSFQQDSNVDLIQMKNYIRQNDYSYYQKNKDNLLAQLKFMVSIDLSLTFKEG